MNYTDLIERVQDQAECEINYIFRDVFDQLEQNPTEDEKIELLEEIRDHNTESDWQDAAQEMTFSVLDSQLIYTADIRELWDALGEPDPDESLGAYDSISDAISAAVFDALMNEPLADDALEAMSDCVKEHLSELEIDFTDESNIPDIAQSAIDLL